MSISAETKQLVRVRAANRCEYCRLEQIDSPEAPLQIEHVIPKKHRGSDHDDNLALACIDCNLHKGPNLSGIDPDSGQLTPLFNPRLERWDDHFEEIGPYIYGKTATGRVTVLVLNLNSAEQVELRRAKLSS